MKTTLQVIISVLLLAAVFSKIDVAKFALVLRHHSQLPWLLLSIVFFNASKIVSAYRLNVYQRQGSVFISDIENLRLYYAGMFLNFFLPGGIGGDGYKIILLNRRRIASIKTLFRLTVTDRLNGLLVLLFLVAVSMPLAAYPLTKHAAAVGASVGSSMALTAFAIIHRTAVKVGLASMALLFAYGLSVQLLQVACMASLLMFLNVPFFEFGSYLNVFLISSVAAVLPVSFGGLGAREATFYGLLSFFKMDASVGVVASGMFFLITLTSSLMGIAFLGSFGANRKVLPL